MAGTHARRLRISATSSLKTCKIGALTSEKLVRACGLTAKSAPQAGCEIGVQSSQEWHAVDQPIDLSTIVPFLLVSFRPDSITPGTPAVCSVAYS